MICIAPGRVFHRDIGTPILSHMFRTEGHDGLFYDLSVEMISSASYSTVKGTYHLGRYCLPQNLGSGLRREKLSGPTERPYYRIVAYRVDSENHPLPVEEVEIPMTKKYCILHKRDLCQGEVISGCENCKWWRPKSHD